MNEADEPRPVPAGISARLTISIPGSTLCSRSASRIRGCWMESIASTRSNSEYLRK